MTTTTTIPTITSLQTSTVETNDALDSYLALTPRGLEAIACDWLHAKLSDDWQVQTSFLDQEHLPAALLEEQQRHFDSKRRRTDVSSQCCRHQVGTIPQQPHDVSFGYDSCKDEQNKQPHKRLIWTVPGQLRGTVWLHLQTNAPARIVASLRGLGPLLSLAGFWKMDLSDTRQLENIREDLQQQQLMATEYQWQTALGVWKAFVKASWGLSKQEQQDLDHKLASSRTSEEPLKYRLSCVRVDSKQYKYTRREFLAAIADVVTLAQDWKVDLKHYDLEVVLLVRAHCLAVGFALRPYQKLKANSFASGNWPPDTAAPYYNRETSPREGLVRLRPATAQLLLHQCRLQPGEVVLDPCVGVGSLALETLFQSTGVVALGGDLVLTASGLAPLAADYAKCARQLLQAANKTNNRSHADLMAWDATCMPLRPGTVDVVVSDLPFGQHCSSSGKLGSLLPLMVSEWARVLLPQSGRMILLCGSYIPLLEALIQTNNNNNNNLWQLPCLALFPVNIGGMLAWVVQVLRGSGHWSPLPNQRERVRKLTARRNHIQQMQRGVGGKAKRLQA